ncbi:MAG: clostripain-related cysteine peptidase [Bacteroidales bacterium]|nr:clostripain-related cysteine peptidase [Bacteroidales bacterium]
MKSFYKVFIPGLVICLFSFSSCKKDDTTPELPNRTVIVYMVSDNALYENALDNIEQMKEGWGAYDGNLIIYFDSPNDLPRLMKMEKNGTLTTIKAYPDQNSALPGVMKGAIGDAQRLYPAKSYGVILWSHGTGWVPYNTFYSSSRSMSSGIQYLHSNVMLPEGFVKTFAGTMTLQEVDQALPSGLDFIIFDACFMGGIEVAYELRDKASYILASPTEILSYGMPYEDIIPELFETEADLLNAAQKYYTFYMNQTGYSCSGSIGLVKCSELEALALATKNIVQNKWETIQQLDLLSVQILDRYALPVYHDLGNFIEKISTPGEYAAFETQLDKTVLYKASTPYFVDVSLDYISGLSCFIPKDQGDKFLIPYARLDWAKAIGLSSYIQ